MIVEVNGMAYSINVDVRPDTKTRQVRIVDEAFLFQELEAEVPDRAGVVEALEAYSGMRLDLATQYRLRHALP